MGNSSYEQHLEKWIENTSKMNFDYVNDNTYNNFNSINGSGMSFHQHQQQLQQQQQLQSQSQLPPTYLRNGNNRQHLQHQNSYPDPLSLPSQFVS